MPFITYRFSDGISLIQESGVANFMRCNIWLVRGPRPRPGHRYRDGAESLKDRISGDTDRPLTAVTTHAHFDHIAGLHEFDERLGHRSEAGIYAAPTQAATVYTGAWKQITIVDPTVHPAFDPMTFSVTPAPLTGYLDEGDVLDLGDRAFQILHLPGHSPGSIGLLDRDARVLFRGMPFTTENFSTTFTIPIPSFTGKRSSGLPRSTRRLFMLDIFLHSEGGA